MDKSRIIFSSIALWYKDRCQSESSVTYPVQLFWGQEGGKEGCCWERSDMSKKNPLVLKIPLPKTSAGNASNVKKKGGERADVPPSTPSRRLNKFAFDVRLCFLTLSERERERERRRCFICTGCTRKKLTISI